MFGFFAHSLNLGGSVFSPKGKYIKLIPVSVVSATVNPLYVIYLGSDKNSFFLLSEESMQTPFFPCVFASRIHSDNKSFEYPCPFIAPAIQRQLI